MTTTPMELAETYFTAWQAQDADALRAVLADNISCVGPMATLDNAEDAVRGLMGLAAATTELERPQAAGRRRRRHHLVRDQHRRTPARCPPSNWSHVEDGKITAIRVAFDPRPLLG